jgi:hypothetical protein
VYRRDIDKNKALEFKQNYRAIVISWNSMISNMFLV